nr:hypothetical protein [uncultured Actinoplanes sp.]
MGAGRHDWVDRARTDQFSPLGGAPVTTGLLADFLTTALLGTAWEEPPYAEVRDTPIGAR